MTFIARDDELAKLESFTRKPGAGFTFLRGRRRIGKTWLLKEYQSRTPKCFYFMGLEDTNDAGSRKAFATAWYDFSKDKTLVELSKDHRSWSRIFEQISVFLQKNREQNLIVILDEIQWIAKKNSGFVSLLKQAWVDWQRIGNIKVIVCGSSNKFFSKRTSSANDILRGIKTSASIWVHEFTLSEVEKHYLQDWSRSEICLLYMMLGGVPYYLEALEPEKGFIHCINDAIFLNDSIFLEEVNQVLKLEFNSTGLATTRKILSHIGQQGSTITSIAERAQLPLSSVSSAIEKILEYQIVFARTPMNTETKENSHGIRYYMKDFFLNFYFQVLEPFESIIQHNQDQLIFTSKSLLSNAGYYMPNFSGHAFELLCQRVLEIGNLNTPLNRKLLLKTPGYTVGTFWDNSVEIDLVVEDNNDRISRLIECKWIDSNSKFSVHTKEIKAKKYPTPTNFTQKRYLLAAYEVTDKQKQEASASGVDVLSLNDLF